MASSDQPVPFIIRNIINPYATTPEENERGIFSGEKAIELRGLDIDMIRHDFSLFTEHEMDLKHRQLIFFSLTIQAFKKMQIFVVNSQTKMPVSLTPDNFSKERCGCYRDSPFKIDKDTLSCLLPKGSLIFNFPKLPLKATPPSIKEFNLLFKKILPINEQSKRERLIHDTEYSPYQLLIGIIKKEFPESCLWCILLLSLLHVKKIFTETLFLIYPKEIPNPNQLEILHHEITKTENVITDTKALSSFRHKLYHSLLLESYFYDILLDVGKVFRKRFCFYLKEQWQYVSEDYEPRRIIDGDYKNAVITIILYLGYDALNVVHQTVFLMVMNVAWFSRFNSRNPHLYTFNPNVSKLEFYLVDIEEKKLVFDNSLKQ